MTDTDDTISTYEGWKRFAERPVRTPPARLSTSQLAKMSQKARRTYERERNAWHANILLRTPQVAEVHDQLWDIVDANGQDSGQVRGAAAIDSPPALGKSTTANAFAKDFHRREVDELGHYVDDGDTLRLPVCRVSLSGSVTTKGLHQQILNFYAHPTSAVRSGYSKVSGQALAEAAADCVRRHRTKLLIIDDIHFLNPRRVEGGYVANQLKWIANEYDATLLFAGIGLTKRGILSEGFGPGQVELAQTGRRWTLLTMRPYASRSARDDKAWRELLLGIEQKIILADATPGMLANQLGDYLFARSQGVMGSLMPLVTRGAARAIRTGHEKLDEELLEHITIDHLAESQRQSAARKLERRRAAPRKGASSGRGE